MCRWAGQEKQFRYVQVNVPATSTTPSVFTEHLLTNVNKWSWLQITGKQKPVVTNSDLSVHQNLRLLSSWLIVWQSFFGIKSNSLGLRKHTTLEILHFFSSNSIETDICQHSRRHFLSSHRFDFLHIKQHFLSVTFRNPLEPFDSI